MSSNINFNGVEGYFIAVKNTAKQMIEVLAEFDGLSVPGFISPTSLTRSNRREITFFVNGRPVQDRLLVDGPDGLESWPLEARGRVGAAS